LPVISYFCIVIVWHSGNLISAFWLNQVTLSTGANLEAESGS
jgi:hypothetical protein